jgi:hypothetical protein
MFNGLKYVKLGLVILVCVLAFPFDYHKNIVVREGYTNKLSVIKGDSITVYMDCKEKHRKGQFLLYDIHYRAIDSAIAFCEEQKISTLKAWQESFGYNPTLTYSANKLKSGIYFWNKFIPFIVTEKKKCDITLVIPLMNIQTESSFGGKSFYAYNSSNNDQADTLSIKRPARFPANSEAFIIWLDSLYPNQNYMSDYDLEDISIFENSKMLIFYDNVSFISKKARENIDAFINKGGNILILTSSVMNNILSNNSTENLLIFNSHHKDNSSSNLWNDHEKQNSPNYLSIGGSYECNFSSDTSLSFLGYKIISTKNPLLTGADNFQSELPTLTNDLYASPPLVWVNGLPILDTSKVNYYRSEIIAYGINRYSNYANTGTFFVLQNTPTSGYVINTGCMSWTKSEQLKNNTISNIIKNSIEILKSGKSPFVKDAI